MSDVIQHTVDLIIALYSDTAKLINKSYHTIKSDRTVIVIIILIIGYLKLKTFIENELQLLRLKSI